MKRRNPRPISLQSRFLAAQMISQGTSIQRIVDHFHSKLPSIDREKLQRMLFPRFGIYKIDHLKGASNKEVTNHLGKMKKWDTKNKKRLTKNNKTLAMRQSSSKVMKQLHTQPDFAKRVSARASLHTASLWQNESFRTKMTKSARKRMKQLHTVPEFIKERDLRAKALGQAVATRVRNDPKLAEKLAKQGKTQLEKLRTDPKTKRAHKKRMQELHKQSEYRRKVSAGVRRKISIDLEYAKMLKLRGQERFIEMWKDPKFRKAHRRMMIKLHADPEYQKKRADGIAQFFLTRKMEIAELMRGRDTVVFSDNEYHIKVESSPLTEALAIEKRGTVLESLTMLSSLEKNIIEMRFGFLDERPLSISECAVAIGKTPTETSKLFKQAILKLSKDKRIRELLE